MASYGYGNHQSEEYVREDCGIIKNSGIAIWLIRDKQLYLVSLSKVLKNIKGDLLKGGHL
jgi:hypothetical protein